MVQYINKLGIAPAAQQGSFLLLSQALILGIAQEAKTIIKQCGIYKILNIITRDYYLGGAVDIHRRWYEHRLKLRKNLHGKNTYFQNAWNKYGEQAFEFSVVLLCDISHKLYFEDGLIKLLKPAYNISEDALAPMQGRHHTEETKRKISTAHKGENNYWFGKRHSEETKLKISETKSGSTLTEETKQRISEGGKGKRHKPNFGT